MEECELESQANGERKLGFETHQSARNPIYYDKVWDFLFEEGSVGIVQGVD